MPDVRHSALTWRLFDMALSVFRNRLLLPTRFGGAWPAVQSGRPAVLVANHVSWWDGFLLREVQKRIRPDVPFHTVVVEAQLEEHPFLRRLGGVPVDPSAASSILRMLRTLGRLRAADPDTVFAYFPQGRIWPTSRRPLAVRRGIEAVARILAPVDVIPVSIHIEPLVDARPTPFLWIGEPLSTDDLDNPATSAAVEARLSEGLDHIRDRLDRWGEDARTHWPEATTASGDAAPQQSVSSGPAGAVSPVIEPNLAS